MRDLQIQDMEANKALFGQQFLETQTREKNIKELISQKQHELTILQGSLHHQKALINQAQVHLNSGDEVIAARASIDQCQAAIANLEAQIAPTHEALEQAQNAFNAAQANANHARGQQEGAQNHRNSINWDSYKWTAKVTRWVSTREWFKDGKWKDFYEPRHDTPRYERDLADADSRLHNANEALNNANHALQGAQQTLDEVNSTRANLFAQRASQEETMNIAQVLINQAEQELQSAQDQAEVLKSSINDTLKEQGNCTKIL